MKGGISQGSHKNNLAFMRKLKTLFFFTSKQCIYNIEVKSHNKCIKIYSDINTANSLTLTNEMYPSWSKS